jgi:hypothetical protein
MEWCFPTSIAISTGLTVGFGEDLVGGPGPLERCAAFVARSDLLRGHLRPDAALGRGIGAPQVQVKVGSTGVTAVPAVPDRTTDPRLGVTRCRRSS